LYNAVNVRKQALGQSAFTIPTVGDICHNDTFFSTLQSWVQINCTSFVRSHNDDGTAREITSYKDIALENWSWTTLKTVLGINAWAPSTVGSALTSAHYNQLYNAIRKLLWVAAPINTLGVPYFRWATDGQSVGGDVVSSSTRPTVITVPTGATQVTIGHSGTWGWEGAGNNTPDTWATLANHAYPSSDYQSTTLHSQNIELLSGVNAGQMQGFFATASGYSGGPYTMNLIQNGEILTVTGIDLTLSMFTDYWYTNTGNVTAIVHWNNID
jgi:hypothetical protein